MTNIARFILIDYNSLNNKSLNYIVSNPIFSTEKKPAFMRVFLHLIVFIL